MDLRTPHPTLQSLSQAFKLPSSSPQPSPRPLSPVPTSSVNLKENDCGRPLATSTPWNRHASKPGIPSMPSSSGKARSRLSQRRYSHHHSRSSSHSLSRSNASSRASSKEPYSRRSGKPGYGRVPKSGSENPGGNELSVTNAPRRKSTKTRRATTAALPLASPFMSRASSPTGGAPENAHITTEFSKTGIIRQYTNARRRSAIHRSILTDTRYDSNLPVKTIIGDAPALPQDKKGASSKVVYTHDFTLAKRKNKGFEKSIYVHNRTGSALKRQPSAPGALRYASTLRQKSILGPDRANKKTTESADEKFSTKGISTEVDYDGRDAPVADTTPNRDDPGLRSIGIPNQTKSKNSDSVGDNPLKPTKPHNDPPTAGPLIRPSLSMHDLQSRNTASHPERDYIHETHSNGGDERTAWMHMRSGVDFNRPPSQVSLIQAAGLDLGYSHQTWGDSLFSSSSSGASSCDENVGQASESELGKRDKFCRGRFPFDNLSMQVHEDEEAGLDFGIGFGLGLETAMGFDFDLDDMNEDDVPFGADIRHTSTPIGTWRRTTNLSADEEIVNLHIRKIASSPVIRSGDVVEDDREERRGRNGLPKSVSAEELRKLLLVREQASGNLEVEGSGNGTLAMERVHTYIDALENADEAETQSAFSWTTDSLISIPTVYLEKQKKRMQSSSCRDKKMHDNEIVSETGHQSSSTSESSSLAELTLGPAFEVECHGVVADEIQDSERVERLAKPIQFVSDITGNMTTKRTRSGTIVPANPRVPPGARRTRSGTIVGPLPATPPPTFELPAIPAPGGLVDAVSGNCSAYSRVGAAPTRTRSGTVVASTSVVRPSASDLGAKGRKRGASVSGMRPMQNAASSGHQTDLVVMYEAEDIAERDDDEHIVECYVDSLYLPVESSPDPLDLLRFAGIAEAEDEDEEWRVIREPFSPEAPKTKKRKVGLGLANRAASAGRWLKAKSKLTARFVGGVDEEDRETTHGECEAGALGDVESSDDELLLVDDSASKLMR